jgi:ubiquinone/menaquinone biosynthesis C-methylase UbiE
MTTDTIIQSNSNNVRKTKFSPYALPEYLIQHYWWAYLSPVGMKIFDHGFMVNRILWGQYHSIAKDAVALITDKPEQNVAGISSAYGEFFPSLAKQTQVKNLYLFDIAPIQLERMQNKIPKQIFEKKCHFFLSDAENIAIQNQCIDTSVLFFLLHELPANVRANVLAQALRITKVGGRLVIADYAQFRSIHSFHRYSIFRTVFETMEPFLADFWESDLLAELNMQANLQGRTVKLSNERYYFNEFYRVLELVIE